MLKKKDLILQKVFNNNIILVRVDKVEKILFGKGIGFGRKFGEKISGDIKVEKTFVIEGEDTQRNLKNVLERVDDNFFALCENGILEISKELREELNENIHIGLIDHLNFAVSRLSKGEEIENPFLAEIETLYSLEFNLASKLAKKIEVEKDIVIPDGEIGFIALHIHSARNNGKLSNTIKNSFLSNTIIEYLEEMLGIEIDRQSLDYARFLTHIRFAIERIRTKKKIENDLIYEIKNKYKDSYKVAEQVAKIIGDELLENVSEDETAYLAMHIERFRRDYR